MIEHSTPEVLVTEKAVYFDGYELPWFISENGISFKPGGSDDCNRMMVEFLVGTVTFKDTWQEEHDSEWFWLSRVVALEFRVQQGAFDRIMKEYA
ncbi:hypothetical protein KIY85_gp40 [Mycobacterium phage Heffalump]|uniref:Uncharacterized protein n=1 Tax=Mycobacterium phage Heffalump TaxID=1983575 RepID=A0A220NSE3_9CAUD|nr:hypothetical protein KIY85_gp40 [Mycobacterium phage Heffalump]ASJ79737.1 hypothetical protein SEA_HEFFALUMP_40 [Mycobacterium phage Heffalump]